jgi:Haem-degrading
MTSLSRCTMDQPTAVVAKYLLDEPPLFVGGLAFSIRSSTAVMTREKAQRIIEAGIVKAKEIGQPMNIAVVDAGANLTAFTRMDGAWLGSIDIAINKARIRRWLGQLSRPGCRVRGLGRPIRTWVLPAGLRTALKG